MYSSADAAIIDLQSTTTIAGHSLAEPQAIWFALWDNANNLTGTPYMSTAVWPVANRSKQYAGNRVVIGGRDLARHRRRLGGQRGCARVTGKSPIRTGRIQFAITGPCS